MTESAGGEGAGQVKRSGRPAHPGRGVRASGKDGPQIIESGGARWTEEAETVFLDQLAASCNVGLSANKAGFTKGAVYARRRTDPGFAARWQVALEQGYARIEIMLVKAAEDSLAGLELDPDTPIPRMTVKEAINVLQLHRAAVRGEGKHPGWLARPRSLDEVRDSILRKLSAIEASCEAD